MKIVIFCFYALVVLGIVVAFIKVAFGGKSKPSKKNVRNYVVRFDPVKEKYYIANELETHDEDVTNWLGNRVFYADKVKAEFIVQKLN